MGLVTVQGPAITWPAGLIILQRPKVRIEGAEPTHIGMSLSCRERRSSQKEGCRQRKPAQRHKLSGINAEPRCWLPGFSLQGISSCRSLQPKKFIPHQTTPVDAPIPQVTFAMCARISVSITTSPPLGHS